MFLVAIVGGDLFGATFHHARAMGWREGRSWRAAHRAMRQDSGPSSGKPGCKHFPSTIVRSHYGELETCVNCGQFRHTILGERSSWLLPNIAARDAAFWLAASVCDDFVRRADVDRQSVINSGIGKREDIAMLAREQSTAMACRDAVLALLTERSGK